MNLLFLNPPFAAGAISRTSRSPAVTKGGTLYYPIWLAYATSVAEEACHEVRLIDAPAAGLDLATLLARLEGFEPALIVVDTSTPSIYEDAATVAALKRRYPAAFTVLVGTHPTALPEETLALDEAIDAIALGEYDYTIRDLAAALERGTSPADVPGLALRHGTGVLRTATRELIADLDRLPFVSAVYRRHLDPRHYRFAAANYPMTMIMTSRGCPQRCFFCVYPQVFHSHKYRRRSAESVVEEFAEIATHSPDIREIGIEDDTFTADLARVERICRLLIERKIKVRWYCNVRGDLEYPLLRLMRQAGCRLVTVGFESGDQQVLDGMRKNETPENYRRFAEAARKAGVLVHGCIMVGNPGDSRETLRRSYEMAVELECDSMQFYPLYLYPGTKAWSWAEDHGYLKTRDFSRWLDREGMHNCVHDTPELGAAEMVALCDHYLKKYHFRPRYLIRKGLQALRHPSEGLRSLRSGGSFVAKIVGLR